MINAKPPPDLPDISGYFLQAYSIASLAQAVLNVILAQFMLFDLNAESILSVSDSSFITTTGMYFSVVLTS